MNTARELPPSDDEASARLARWRAEVQDFYQQTIAELQRIATYREPPRSARESSYPPSYSPAATGTAPMSSRDTIVDSDCATDRLANLKRQLAAKLSNAQADEPSSPTRPEAP